MSREALEELLRPYNQEHLLQFWDHLSPEEQASFSEELHSVDFQRVHDLSTQALNDLKNGSVNKDELIEPLPLDVVGKLSTSTQEQKDEWYDHGLQLIANGTVGALLLAGGQGTRLGVSYPKGMYDVGLPSGKTLYQLQAERIKHLEQMARDKYSTQGAIRWYVMTSEATLTETKKYFEENEYFGLDVSNVVFFEQFLLPCLTFDGKMMLQSKSSLAQAPDGNGGLYRALKSTKMLEDFATHNIEHIYVYCVDNILVKIADPVFIGYCGSKQLECANKVIEKVDPDEAVGVVCKCGDRYQVVEYSEMSPAVSQRRREDGSLVFNASNICIHYFSTSFLNKVCDNHLQELPHHIAKKKIPHLDEQGNLVKPTSPNGMKLEKFVFDVFPFSTKFGALECERQQEFSPLKNGPGVAKCSPESCRTDLLLLHTSYLRKAGASFVGGIDSDDVGEMMGQCEISPYLSYAGEGLDAFKGKRFDITKALHLEDESSVQDGDLSPKVDIPPTPKKKRVVGVD